MSPQQKVYLQMSEDGQGVITPLVLWVRECQRVRGVDYATALESAPAELRQQSEDLIHAVWSGNTSGLAPVEKFAVDALRASLGKSEAEFYQAAGSTGFSPRALSIARSIIGAGQLSDLDCDLLREAVQFLKDSSHDPAHALPGGLLVKADLVDGGPYQPIGGNPNTAQIAPGWKIGEGRTPKRG